MTSDLGARTLCCAHDSSRERLKEVLASEERPEAEGVAAMRRMDGIGGRTLGPACVILAPEACDGVAVGAMFDRASRGREDRIISSRIVVQLP